MFDMTRIGEKLSAARKAKDMTQTELADVLGISFQAVSNWERGNSMPDIAKLPEIAEILALSLDELLACGKPLAESIEAGTVEEYLCENAVGKTAAALAPLMKPSQTEAVVRKMVEAQDAPDIIELLPFIGQELCDELAEKRYREKGVGALDDFLPFISGRLLESIAAEEFEQNGLHTFECIAPFLNRDALRMYAAKAIERDGIKAISPIAPFLGRDFLVKYVREMYL